MVKKISAEEFDALFDSGEDISDYIDWSKAERPGRQQQRVNVDVPVWMLNAIDHEATRLGITRQSLIKVWFDTMLKSTATATGTSAIHA